MELRKKRLFEVKMSQIIKEISIYSFFLLFLYVVAFSNLSGSSFQYNQLFITTFVEKQSPEEIGLNDVRKLEIFFLLIIQFCILIRDVDLIYYFIMSSLLSKNQKNLILILKIRLLILRISGHGLLTNYP